ncbi:FkbM family methyltransferase [Alienimonas californiensis]|uniref:2-O-methyltransferase NoeI n=1 Tax=Alienimonas californiensis TaxID=2527989 RepID=A0A517P829_9PLAN|nr:FkbM family methyltransferase [Alienimonas californiensis]QDT15495.1 2-O-methyltransferase NoeI [Alienimonas californiensis]
MIDRLWKPWFVRRPERFARRIWTAVAPPAPGVRPLRTAWGATIAADPTKDIGRSVLTTGVYDLTLSEVVARLTPPGGRAIDAGANVGYVSVLAALCAGPGGRVDAYEPHPDLAPVAERNLRGAADAGPLARVAVHPVALGERPGRADLILPAGFGANDGLARLAEGASGGSEQTGERRVSVDVRRLDDELNAEGAGGAVDLLKIDVEGHEAPLLRGAAEALAAGRIRHVLFEDHAVHDAAGSEVTRLLEEAGFTLFSLGRTFHGLHVEPLAAGRLASSSEPPNYLATRDPEAALAALRPPGWRVLERRFPARPAARGRAEGRR